MHARCRRFPWLEARPCCRAGTTSHMRAEKSQKHRNVRCPSDPWRHGGAARAGFGRGAQPAVGVPIHPGRPVAPAETKSTGRKDMAASNQTVDSNSTLHPPGGHVQAHPRCQCCRRLAPQGQRRAPCSPPTCSSTSTSSSLPPSAATCSGVKAPRARPLTSAPAPTSCCATSAVAPTATACRHRKG